jgi:hypothetical protein
MSAGVMCFGFLGIVMSCNLPDGQATAVVCPPVRTWAPAFQKQVAKELRAAKDSALARVVVEAIGDRDIARACAAHQKTK